MQYYKVKYTIYKRYLLHMHSYIEYIPSLHIPHTLAQLVDCGIYDFPLIILTTSLMRVLRQPSLSLYFSLSLSLYTLDLSQLSNIAICQSRIEVSQQQQFVCGHGNMAYPLIHSFVFTRLRHFHFHFPFWIFNSNRFDSQRFSITPIECSIGARQVQHLRPFERFYS